MLSVSENFEAHAKTYCEAVFRQIRARLFGGEEGPAPILLLRALTAKSC